MSGKAALWEIEEKWNLVDLVAAGQILDLQEDADRKAMKAAQKPGPG